MDIINPMHSTTVSVVDTTPLTMPISVDFPSLIRSEDSVSTSGVMLQGITNLISLQATARVQLTQVDLLHHLLVMTSFVSPALTQHHPTSGTPPTLSGMAKAATVVASAAARAPWFFKALPEEATSNIEVRWCQPAGISSDKTGIEQLEIYVF